MAGHYSNRPDLLEQLRKVAVILSSDGHDGSAGAAVAGEVVVRSRACKRLVTHADPRSESGVLPGCLDLDP